MKEILKKNVFSDRALIKKKKYVLFIFFGILSLLAFGLFEFYTTMLFGGYPKKVLVLNGEILLNTISDAEWDMALPIGLILGKKYYENQLQLSNLLRGQKENELRLLRSQFNPHFLFNNLNTLDALIDTSPKKSKAFISKLASTYRYLIEAKNQDVRTLKEELELARNYFYLISTRFGNDYELNVFEEENSDHKYLPTGSVQSLLENAVKHNKATKDKPVKIELLIGKDDIVLKNNKTSKQKDYISLGTGLNNLKERYRLLFQEQIHVSETEKDFWVQMPLVNLIKQ